MAAKAAESAFPDWSSRTVKSRASILLNFHALVEKHAVELAKLIVSENGKNIAEAIAEVAKGNETVEYACSMPQLVQGRTLEVSSGVQCRDKREALGVVGCVVPFNFPFMVPCWTIPIALVCGNCVILKPSEKVPMTMYRVVELLQEAGLPPGVFQMVQGKKEVVDALMHHSSIKAVSFVGSSPVAKYIHSTCSALHKRVLALGGAKNHLIALQDADISSTAADVAVSFAGCAGQRCMAASVLLLAGDNSPLLQAVAEKAKTIRPGQEMGEMGPVIDELSYQKIINYIAEAENRGSKVLVDGRSWSELNSQRGGFWIGPTVLHHSDPAVPAMTEEIFGPVLSVYTCSTWDQAIDIENASPFGNAASIYTTVSAHADYFLHKFHAAMLGVNIGIPVPREPFSFGGLYGTMSKYGDFDITGDGAIEFFTNRIKVTTRWPKPLQHVQNLQTAPAADQASFVGQM